MAIVLIDLPNLYNSLARKSVGGKTVPKDYIVNWLELDLLARSLTGAPPPGIWVFYAERAIGSGDHRLETGDLCEYIKRIDKLPGVTSHNAGVPGEQSETFVFECSECHHPNAAQTTSEKGVDTALIVHLFDTIEHWKRAYILSQDADYSPAVNSLRRRGKLVFGAGVPESASHALVRECYEYINIVDEFIAEDFIAYQLLSDSGLAKKVYDTLPTSKGVSSFELTCGPKGERYVVIFKLQGERDSEGFQNVSNLMEGYSLEPHTGGDFRIWRWYFSNRLIREGIIHRVPQKITYPPPTIF